MSILPLTPRLSDEIPSFTQLLQFPLCQIRHDPLPKHISGIMPTITPTILLCHKDPDRNHRLPIAVLPTELLQLLVFGVFVALSSKTSSTSILTSFCTLMVPISGPPLFIVTLL